ncbi:MAG: galactokinase [Balneolaceae bacterium]|nr:MAG: galactokinase [Balneolaceae bacterium]
MDELQDSVRSAYSGRFDNEPIMVCAPGRVNLIGEHTDYNKGFVLPAAIDKAIILAMSKNNLGLIRLLSVDMSPDYVEIPVAESYDKNEVSWANYLIGVVSELQKAGHRIGGFDCSFGGDVPIGAGLSSSAALESGVAFGLSDLFGLNLTKLEMTKIAMQAENNFVGVKCGIMDQFASLHGKKDSVIKLDCRSLGYEYYPFRWHDVRILLCDTMVRRTLAGSEYNIRRKQCEEGVAIIKKVYPEVNSLRDVTTEQLESQREKMDAVVYRRCLYVLNENKRVAAACEDLLSEDLKSFGEKMYQSHHGLKENYEVSCYELDVLVDATEGLDGVLGARMMGGGFGGCTINLVTISKLEETRASIRDYYFEKTGKEPGFHVVKIGNGTHLLTEDSEIVTRAGQI